VKIVDFQALRDRNFLEFLKMILRKTFESYEIVQLMMFLAIKTSTSCLMSLNFGKKMLELKTPKFYDL
jgi:hypothetical protein